MDSQVDASQPKFANHNLCTDLPWVAKQIRKSARAQVTASRKKS